MYLGRFMLNNDYNPDIILCSPAKRTRQTLDNLKESINANNIIFPDILYNGSAGDYLYEIQKISDDCQNILLIAHNPSIYELVILLAAQGSDKVLQKLSMGYHPATLSIVKCKCNKWSDIQPVENELSNIISSNDYS